MRFKEEAAEAVAFVSRLFQEYLLSVYVHVCEMLGTKARSSAVLHSS